jgi:ATP-dependent protease HslVU (ClpYQ) peptidase subunit
MLEASNGFPIADTTANTRTLQQELAANSQHASRLMQVNLSNAQTYREETVRHQLESMLMHAERAVSNEESARTMSRLFSKFSMLQKIMQSMG